MKMKKSVLIMMISILALIVTACGSGGDKEASGKKEVQLWTLDTKKDSMDFATKEFNEKNEKYSIKPSYYSIDSLKQNLKVSASSKSMPDVWFNWGGDLAKFYVVNDLSYDLTDYAKENKWDDQFEAATLELLTIDDKLAGYPISLNGIGIYYRKDIFEKYGIKVPETIEEFDEVCKVLKKEGITPISTGGKYGWHVMRFVEQLIEHYAGSEEHDKLNNFEISWENNESVIKALDKYKEYVDLGYFPEGFVSIDPNDAKSMIYSGSAAMQTEGQWLDGQIIQDGQDINNFGYFPFPSGGTNRMSAFAETYQYSGNLSEDEIDVVTEFLDFYFSEAVVSEHTGNFNLPIPQKGNNQTPEEYTNVPKVISDMETNSVFTITDQAFPTKVADALFSVQDAIGTGSMNAKEGAVVIQKAIDEHLKEQ